MTNAFDTAGDLWIDIKVDTNRPNLGATMFGPVTIGMDQTGTMPGGAFAVQQFNLTAYIRSLTKPDWVNAALTSTSANIAVEPKDGPAPNLR